MAKIKGLGKGIGAILGTDKIDDIMQGSDKRSDSPVIEVPLSKIQENPLQPRELFNEESIRGLADSIQSMGLINPITVRKEDGKYFIIAGERRFRACKLLGKETIKAIVRDATELENLSMALIENIQRENLNPMEEAKAYRLLINKFKLKQHDLAGQIGKDRSTITNSLRLLNLPEEIQESVQKGEISSGHARTLLALSDKASQIILLKDIIKKELSVRQLEKLVKEKTDSQKDSSPSISKIKDKDSFIRQLEGELREKMGTKVEIQYKGEKGKIEIFFYSLDDFDRLRELLNSI